MIFACERESERVKEMRRRWQSEKAGQISQKRVFFLDETGVTTALTRLYGRAIGGNRAVGSAPQNYGKQINILSAMSRQGVAASLAVTGSVDSVVMSIFVREILLPVLEPGDLVVTDNYSVHKTRRVLSEFEKAKVSVEFLPPYSPDLNPIEKCWSKVKTHLKGAEPRDGDTLYKEIGIALSRVTESDAKGWIRSCGYG
jgi:transposase